MALFELTQEYETEDPEDAALTFKEAAASDIGDVFFCEDEMADLHTVDGKEALIILEENAIKERSSHWEAGAKQNFDTGLYTARTVLYIKVDDYGPKPKSGKLLVLDSGTKTQRTFAILTCEDEGGVYRMTLERTRQ